jgi:hypothetical protein
MKRLIVGLALLLAATSAHAQNNGKTSGGAIVPGMVSFCWNGTTNADGTLAVAPCGTATGGASLSVSPTPYPQGATPITASATGSTGAISATLAAAAGKSTYICGFSYQGSDATAAVAANIAITGTITGTMNFGFVALAAGAAVPQPGPTTVPFAPCVQSSAVNTAIVVTPPTLGTGATIATVSAWGYQL